MFKTKKEDLTPFLGKTVKDKVTGFTGVATGFARYLTGCDQYLVLPKAKDTSTYPDGSWLDVNRLELQECNKVELDTSEDKGCDTSAPKY